MRPIGIPKREDRPHAPKTLLVRATCNFFLFGPGGGNIVAEQERTLDAATAKKLALEGRVEILATARQKAK